MSESLVPARFLVVADASPGLLSRLLEALAKRDLIPDAVRATHDRAAGTLRAEITLHAMPAEMVPLVAGNMGQAIGVHRVQADLPQVLADAA